MLKMMMMMIIDDDDDDGDDDDDYQYIWMFLPHSSDTTKAEQTSRCELWPAFVGSYVQIVLGPVVCHSV